MSDEKYVCSLSPDLGLFLGRMKLPRRIRQSVGTRFLRSEIEPVRLRKGFNFNSAEHVAFLYKDIDEKFFNDLNQYAGYLKGNFNIQSVRLLGFVDEPEKKLPVWQKHEDMTDFFSRKDLNWHMKPISGVNSFLDADYDILIDFSGGNILPLNFLLKESKAKMKVGMRGTRAERYCDFILNMGNQFGVESFVEQLNSYLSNPKIR